MAMATRRPSPAIADINVTPMCDVMIVLLVIFMVATPLLDRAPGLELPPARTADATGDPRSPVVLIRSDGRIEMAGEGFASPGELMIRLQARLETATGSDRAIQVKADRGLSFGQVSAVLVACRTAGADRVTLVATREPGL
jgi:biopolymer transport protein ExbD